MGRQFFSASWREAGKLLTFCVHRFEPAESRGRVDGQSQKVRLRSSDANTSSSRCHGSLVWRFSRVPTCDHCQSACLTMCFQAALSSDVPGHWSKASPKLKNQCQHVRHMESLKVFLNGPLTCSFLKAVALCSRGGDAVGIGGIGCQAPPASDLQGCSVDSVLVRHSHSFHCAEACSAATQLAVILLWKFRHQGGSITDMPSGVPNLYPSSCAKE